MNKAYYVFTASLLIPSNILIPFTQIFHHGYYIQQMADHARIGVLSEANNDIHKAKKSNGYFVLTKLNPDSSDDRPIGESKASGNKNDILVNHS